MARLLLLAVLLAGCGPAADSPDSTSSSDVAADTRAAVAGRLAASGIKLLPAPLPVPADTVGALWADGYRVAGHPIHVGVYRLPDDAHPDSASQRLVEAYGARREEVGVVASGPVLLFTARGEIDMAGGDPETTQARDALDEAFRDGQ